MKGVSLNAYSLLGPETSGVAVKTLQGLPLFSVMKRNRSTGAETLNCC